MKQAEFNEVRIDNKVMVGEVVYLVARVLSHAFALELVSVDELGRKRKGPTVPAENCVLV